MYQSQVDQRAGSGARTRPTNEGAQPAKEVAQTETADGQPLLRDPDFAMKIADLEARLNALEMTSLRILSRANEGGRIGAEPSMTKLLGSHMNDIVGWQECRDVAFCFQMAGLLRGLQQAHSSERPPSKASCT